MFLTWNSIRKSILLAIALVMVTGCQGGFKSKVFSQAEVQTYLDKVAKEQADQGGEVPASTGVEIPGSEQTPVVATEVTESTTPVDTKQLPAADSETSGGREAPASTVTPEPPAPSESKSEGDSAIATSQRSIFAGAGEAGADSKVLVEIERETVAEDNTQQLLQKNPEAVKLVRGISIAISDKKITLWALVKLGDDFRLLGVTKAEISSGESMSAISGVILRDIMTNQNIAPGLDVIVSASCKTEDCVKVQTRIEFKVGDGVVPAVFELEVVDGKYQIVDSNLKNEVRPFDVALADLKNQIVAAQAAAGDANTPKEGEDQGAQTLPTTVIGGDDAPTVQAPTQGQSTTSSVGLSATEQALIKRIANEKAAKAAAAQAATLSNFKDAKDVKQGGCSPGVTCVNPQAAPTTTSQSVSQPSIAAVRPMRRPVVRRNGTRAEDQAAATELIKKLTAEAVTKKVK